MKINELKNTVNDVVLLRDELKELLARQGGYSLSDFIGRFRNKISFVDHGERDRFYTPYADASMKLSNLQELGDQKLNSSFSTNKAKLISFMNKYIKGMQSGFRNYERAAKD